MKKAFCYPLARLTALLALACLLTHCEDDSARESARQAALQNPAPTAAPAPSAAATDRPPTVGTLNLRAEGGRTSPGSEVCVKVSSPNFREIVSMQYTMTWDPAVIEYQGINTGELPALTANNFGSQKADEGLLTFSWFDPNVQGITLREGSSIYEVCFKAVGQAGSKSRFSFRNEPVVIEISNANSQFLDLEVPPAQVVVE